MNKLVVAHQFIVVGTSTLNFHASKHEAKQN